MVLLPGSWNPTGANNQRVSDLHSYKQPPSHQGMSFNTFVLVGRRFTGRFMASKQCKTGKPDPSELFWDLFSLSNQSLVPVNTELVSRLSLDEQTRFSESPRSRWTPWTWCRHSPSVTGWTDRDRPWPPAGPSRCSELSLRQRYKQSCYQMCFY